jgi:hypothetical protein
LSGGRTDGEAQSADRAAEQKVSTFHDMIHSMS